MLFYIFYFSHYYFNGISYYINTDNKDDIEELIKTISLIFNAIRAKFNEKDKEMLFNKKSRRS